MGKKRSIITLWVLFLVISSATACVKTSDAQACIAIMGRAPETVTTLDKPSYRALIAHKYRFNTEGGIVCGILTESYAIYPLRLGTCTGAYVRTTTPNDNVRHFIGLRSDEGTFADEIEAPLVGALPSVRELTQNYPAYSRCRTSP